MIIISTHLLLPITSTEYEAIDDLNRASPHNVFLVLHVIEE